MVTSDKNSFDALGYIDVKSGDNINPQIMYHGNVMQTNKSINLKF